MRSREIVAKGKNARLGRAPRVGGSATYTVTFTGLDTDSLGSYAEIGNHASIGFTTDPVGGTITQKWGSTFGGSEYGTGSSPTAISAGTLYLEVTRDAEVVNRSVAVRHAPGTAPAIADGQTWTVDDTSVNLDGSASGTGLTFSYALSGSAAGVTINSGTGAITGTPTAVSSGTATITATDQYGRELTDTFTWSAALRTQATGGTDLDLAFPEDSAISSTDLIQNWTDNGNTLTFVSVSPTLPTGLSINSSGVMTGTPTTITADDTYTLTMEDEYGRETADTFTLEVTAVATLSALVVTGLQTAGDLPVEYTVDITTGVSWGIGTGSTPTAAALRAGTGMTDFGTGTLTAGVGETFSFTLASDIDETSLNLWMVVDGSDTVVTATAESPGVVPFAIDTTAPALSSATGTQTGETTADWGVTSDEASGTIYAGVRPSASSALTSAQLIAGAGGAGVDFDSDASPTANSSNGGSFTGLTASTEYIVDTVQVDAQGNTSSVVSSSAFTTAAAITFSAEHIGVIAPTSNGTEFSADFDLSDYDTGDLIILFQGTDEDGSKLSLDGAGSFTRLVYSGGNSGGRMSILTTTLTGPGSATATLLWDNGGFISPQGFSLWAAKGAEVDAFAAVYDGDISDGATETVLPTVSTNKLLACSIGSAGNTPVSWTVGPTELNEVAPGGLSVTISNAFDEDVPASTYTATISGTSGRVGIGLLVLKEAS